MVTTYRETLEFNSIHENCNAIYDHLKRHLTKGGGMLIHKSEDDIYGNEVYFKGGICYHLKSILAPFTDSGKLRFLDVDLISDKKDLPTKRVLNISTKYKIQKQEEREGR